MPNVSDKLPELPKMIFEILQQTQTNLKKYTSDHTTEVNSKRIKIPFVVGSALLIIGIFSSLNNSNTALANIESFVQSHTNSFIVVGLGLLVYNLFKKG